MKNSCSLYPVHINYPLKIADTFIRRFKGLMGQKKVNYGLLLVPCKSIHTFFMRTSIDVIFLDKVFTVIDIKKDVAPWKTPIYCLNAYSVLELPAGYADKLKIIVGQHIKNTPEECI